MGDLAVWGAWAGLMVIGLVMIPATVFVFPFSSLPISSSYALGPMALNLPLPFPEQYRGYLQQYSPIHAGGSPNPAKPGATTSAGGNAGQSTPNNGNTTPKNNP